MLLTIIALSNNNYCIKIVRLFVNKLQMYKVVLRLHVGVHTWIVCCSREEKAYFFHS